MQGVLVRRVEPTSDANTVLKEVCWLFFASGASVLKFHSFFLNNHESLDYCQMLKGSQMAKYYLISVHLVYLGHIESCYGKCNRSKVVSCHIEEKVS